MPARESQPERASQREPARESQLDRASQREPARESQPESDPHGRESQPESVHRGMPPDQDNQTSCGQRHTVTLMHTPKWGRAGSGRKVPPVNKDVKENLSGVGTGSAIAVVTHSSCCLSGTKFRLEGNMFSVLPLWDEVQAGRKHVLRAESNYGIVLGA